ncbi:MAG: nucleoside deaminase [Kiritimatiellae bacterium]|nr:nucleoside deaminase [Kiritimatiellia bacterium]
MSSSHFQLSLPDWVQPYVASLPEQIQDVSARMQVAIALARYNVDNGTGGPFGAAIFEQNSGRLAAAGMNLVVGKHCSLAHAEMVAIMMAQSALKTHDLGRAAGAPYQLVSSTEPCAMCLGAIPWSGVQSLVCGANDADARAVGFDEGEKPSDWQGGYQRRGIAVECGVCGEDAARVLRDYAASGGEIYNSGA